MAVFLLGTQSIKKRFEIRKGQREVTKVVRVRSTDPPSPAVEAQVEVAVAIALGDPYPTDTGMTCSSIDIDLGGVQQRKTVQGVTCWDWQASVTWSSREGNDPNDHKDPTQRPPKVSVDVEGYVIPAKVDLITGRHPVNSAGDSFVREERRGRVTFRIEKFFETFNWEWCKRATGSGATAAHGGYLFSRNAQPWSPVGPYAAILGAGTVAVGCGLITKLTTSNVYENGRYYTTVNAEVQTDDADGWADKVVDQGFLAYRLDGDGEAVKGPIFEDRSGMPTTVPQLLDGTGFVLAPFVDEPVERTFQYYHAKDWSPLQLP